ncbi:Oxoglutarate/iron-dependent dioxygenase [Macleaya cordata]|uniref:2-oxoglutarate-dependent dioxygenase DAO n=1 Tax=Macleaya cordata TaxID=56857 RepID=A0A200PN79_MACCD|nr:Oxoglutarate/iron-dependent dioxygenase [Macleaya cordata]
MGSETPIKIPIVNLSCKDLNSGTDNWFSVRTQVFRALEEFGCFEATYDEVPLELHNEMFNEIQELFDLPFETKIQNKGEKYYDGYFGQNTVMPTREGLGINDAPVLERVQSFTKLMWPEGNDNFCETVHLFTNRVLDLAKMVTKIIFESYGVEKYYNSHVESITSLVRVNKYRRPGVNETKIGVTSHTDKAFVTILQQNQVNGLEVQTKKGEWISVTPSVGSSIVFIGEAFSGWSNGRLHSPHHRVVHKSNETRYSLALFTLSKDLVQVPEELVDEEHPLMFKPFDHFGLLDFYYTEEGQKAESTLKAYCGTGIEKEMGFESGIPCLDFSRDPKDLEEGSEGWKNLCKEVREACEEYGCFQVVYNKVPVELHEEMFKVMKDLFDLPDETKEKNFSSKPYFGYIGKSDEVPLFESLGIHNAPELDQAQAFTDLMWPDGNPTFCKTVNCMSKMMLELERIIRKMVFESYGVESYYDSMIENSESIVRVMKYKPAPCGDDSAVGLLAHTDKNMITVLYQDLQGLEVLTKEGQWLQLAPRQGTFSILAGDTLKAWSNGRVHAGKHRVMMRGEKERYSYALFATLKEGAVVEVPKELVDKDHPLLFRNFNYMDYVRYFYANYHLENAIETYAGAV